jgi:hypothetical protein
MPDYGFGRCDGHHKLVDFRLKGRLIVGLPTRVRIRGALIRHPGFRRAESRPAAAAGCQHSKHCRTDTAYRPRRTRKPCRRSKDGHHASRKPNKYPDSGRISLWDSCEDKFGVVEQRQLNLLA